MIRTVDFVRREGNSRPVPKGNELKRIYQIIENYHRRNPSHSKKNVGANANVDILEETEGDTNHLAEKALLVLQQKLESEIESLKHLHSELSHEKKSLAEKAAQFETENKKLLQERIEKKVPEYVTSAIEVLETSEKSYKSKAWWWSFYGTVVLIIAIAATVTIALFGGGFIANEGKEVSWSMLMFISFKGLIVLGVLSLWAKHAFSVSNSYIHEAIKRSDRAHAINFGKLYLEIYGSTVERKELLDIFENWNIATESAFSKATPSEFDPKAFEKFVEVAKMLNPGKSDKD